MHKDLPSKPLFIISIFFLLLAYLISTVFLMNDTVSVYSTFFFGILGIFIFCFSIGLFVQERKRYRVLAAKELLAVAIISLIVGFVFKGYIGGVFQLLAIFTLLLSLTTFHREKTTKKRK